MKAIIEFNLPEDQDEFDMFNQASFMHNVLWEMSQWLRSQTKYASDDASEDSIKTYYKCQDKLNDLLRDNSVDLF